jgi:pimeloyl-ACP methyl ester carboxylesterase
MATFLYALLVLLALLGLLLLAGAVYEAWAEAADRRRFPPPGQVVTAGGVRLHLLTMGERCPGQPVVILETGQGNWSLAWRDLQPQIAYFARVIAYDRAGLGWSGPAPRRHAPEQMVAQLHAALEAAGERGPYVFTGHAMGAGLARLFAARYPGEMAALVLVDPAHERLADYLPAEAQALNRLATRSRWAARLARFGAIRLAGQRLLLGRLAPNRPAETGALTDVMLSQTLNPRFFASLADECAVFTRPQSWQGLPDTHGDLLLILVAPAAPAENGAASVWSEAQSGRQAICADLLARSTRSHLLPVEAGVDLIAEQPQAILAAIQTAVEVASLRPAAAGPTPSSET